MYKINLLPNELKEIKRLMKKERNKRVYRRLQCVYLNHQGKKNKEIADIVGVCADTITDWIKIYLEDGAYKLCQLEFKNKRQSKINDYIDEIKQDIGDNTISTLAELQDWIKNKYSIKMEKSWLFRCCKKNLIFLTKKQD